LLIHHDALKVDFGDLMRNCSRNSQKAKLTGNLPYNISTAILQRLIDFRENFSEIVIMLQKEVVERIISGPGKRERGYLTVLTEAFFEAVKLFDVPPQAFRPVPKVQSSVIRLKPKKKKDFLIDEAFFKEIVGIGFQQKRKTVFNNFRKVAEAAELSKIFEMAQINPQKRAENLLLEEWISLAELLKPSLNAKSKT
jgi:16S rRNA (adenine1518-N6/adenine1519-N6)-dimethyltransferase